MAETKYKGTIKQHVVPKFHLQNFSDKGSLKCIWLEDGHAYTSNVSDVCGWDWIYDTNPEAFNSMENELRVDEDWMHQFIDILQKDEGYIPNSDDLIKYVCMLSARSLTIIEAVSSLEVPDKKSKIKRYYTDRRHLLNGENRSNFEAFIYCVHGDKEFITADIPYYLQDVRGSEEDRERIGDEYMDPNYVAWFCPISLKQCIVIVKKSPIASKIIEGIKILPEDIFVDNVNCNLAYFANEVIISKNSPKGAYDDAANLKPHPEKEKYRKNIAELRKKHKKDHC